MPGIGPEAAVEPAPEALPNLSPEEARLLSRHFEIFTETTNKLVAAHQSLQSQVHALMAELEQKNAQLNAVNRELARRIRETEEMREYLDHVIDSMQSGLIAIDEYGNLTRINRAACAALGWEIQAPRRIRDIYEEKDRISPFEVHPDLIPKSGEVRLKKHDGDAILVRYTSVPITGGRQGIAPLEADRSGTLFVFEDLSRLRLLEEKVRRANRLTALGELAAGVAHEMRNPLATMRGFLQLLPYEYEDPGFREECSTRLIREIDRLARLTESLLELSRPIRPDDSQTDLGELVREVLIEQGDAMHRENIEVILNLGEIPLLPLDRDRMKQVLLNLVINARQAILARFQNPADDANPTQGTIEIDLGLTEEVWGGDDSLTLLASLCIRDNGKGIEGRHLDNVFDPFFTTKDQGTGLGLALCHRIVEEHGGVIRVESMPGKGAAFFLFFPVTKPM